MNNEIIVDLKGICKDFSGTRVLNNVDLVLRKGEVHALLGENGAGKSTLCKIIGGLFPSDGGEIVIKGHKVETLTPMQAIGLGIASIYQEPNLVPLLTVAENIMLGREPGFLRRREKLDASVKEILSYVKFDLSPGTLVQDLSVHEKQLVEIAKALSLNAELIVMDEPTSAITSDEVKELFNVIRDLKSRGVSIVYISHILQEVFQIADCITVLRDGRLVGTFNINEVSYDSVVEKMVGHKVEELKIAEETHAEGEEVLSVRNLSAGLVQDVSFSVREGEILGIAGLLGAGQRELANAIFGAYKIESGEIFVSGRKVKLKSPRDAIKHGIGFIPSERKELGIIGKLSLGHNIALPSLLELARLKLLINQGKERRLIDAQISRLGITPPQRSKVVVEFSGGNQQKIMLAKWLGKNSKVLLVHEPSRGVDVGVREEIYSIIKELARQGMGLVLMSIDVGEIMRLCNRVIVLRKGRIAKELRPEETTAAELLTLATVGNSD